MTSPLSPEAVAQMQRYHNALGCMDKRHDGDWVQYSDAAAIITKLREDLEMLAALKNAHKMRADNHWETLRSIRVLAREGKLEHIIQHVNDAGQGYTQPDEVTMWELQSAITTLAAENATLRADNHVAVMQRAEVVERLMDDISTLRASEAAALEALAEIGAVVAALEGKDSLDREMIRNIGTRIAALTPTSDKEPKT